MNISKYIKAFETLRVDRTHGIAPHKPILMLSILQSYRTGAIRDRRIYLTPELVALFKSNWTLLVTSKHDCAISYPFYHLKSSGFWKLIPRHERLDLDAIGSAIKSFNRLNESVEYALLEDDLARLMKSEHENILLQSVLLDKFFPDTKGRIVGAWEIQRKLLHQVEEKILEESSADYIAEINTMIATKNEEEIFLRGGVFKREVPKIYDNTCCISGMRVDAMTNISMVDACHIRPFSISHDDTISNGISLCPNLHRAFDRGLISIDDDYRVLVSRSFTESASNYALSIFRSKGIKLPSNKKYYPAIENLRWHRENVFISD